MNIRLAEKKDARPLAKLHMAAWKIAYAPILSKKQFVWASVEREVRRIRKQMESSIPILVAEEDDQPLGFLVYGSAEAKNHTCRDIEIFSFWVHHDRTRQGIGTKLLNDLIDREDPKNIFVWALTGVTAGPSFYESFGFRAEEETRQDFAFLDKPLPMVRYCKARQRKIRRKK